MHKVLLTAVALLGLGSPFVHAQLLDDFDVLSGWKAVVSEGAKLSITNGEGSSGKALVMEFDLSGAYGYTIARKDISINLPANYQFVFDMRAESPINNFEFKIIDSLENVWWIKKLNIVYPPEWTRQRIKKRHLTFAWGPSGGGEIRRVKAVEFVVSSGKGGKGKVFIDNFRFEPIDINAAEKVKASFTSSSKGKAKLSGKGTLITQWTGTKTTEWITIDFGYQREVGGLVIDWGGKNHASAYDVQLSDDGREWTTVSTVTNGNGVRDYLYLHEQEGRYLKLVMKKRRGKEYAVTKLEVKESRFGASANDFFTAIAKEQPKGHFPKYFLQQQCFWTVVGTPGDVKEALINEVGTIEVEQLGFSLEPFLFVNNKLVTWNDVERTQSLENGYLPIPSVEWKYGDLKLTVRAFAAGVAGNSMLIATYRIENMGGYYPNAKLFIALRPFQVNPPWQWLNQVGGASRIDSVRIENGMLLVDSRRVIPLKTPAAFGATSFENGDITEYLSQGRVPSMLRITDRVGFGSAAIEYALDARSGEMKDYHVVVPFHTWPGSPTPNMNAESADFYISLAHSATISMWERILDRFQVTLPASARSIINTVKSNLAYIFINQDGPRIQPGSRSYERSWIRDGSLTSTALLQMGVQDQVRAYADWYAQYQFPSGKIPCVVDTRGGDPTNEHDSHGQMIYLIMQYFHFTRDTAWLRGKWDTVVKAIRYVQSLRAERKTDVYRYGTPIQRACYGLVPESISHEGYWTTPMHSYWDDFFVLRGLKDAASMAEVLGEKLLYVEFAAERDDFRTDLYASMRLAMQIKGIDYIPGCVELGDFDATSTTIGVNPGNELGGIPEPQLHNTFDKYFDYFTKRRSGQTEWKDYTPYETRVIGTFVYLDQKERAHEAVEFFMNDRHPAGWNHWAEVVHRDPLTPKYIGDMPHTWVGSDFIRSIRAMFVYEREQDNALVVGAGIPEKWLDEGGVEAKDLPTYFGTLSFAMKNDTGKVLVELRGNVEVPPGMVVLKSPKRKPLTRVRVNGEEYAKFNAQEVILKDLPARVELVY